MPQLLKASLLEQRTHTPKLDFEEDMFECCDHVNEIDTDKDLGVDLDMRESVAVAMERRDSMLPPSKRTRNLSLGGVKVKGRRIS